MESLKYLSIQWIITNTILDLLIKVKAQVIDNEIVGKIMETATGVTKALNVIEIITLIKTKGIVNIEIIHRGVLIDKL